MKAILTYHSIDSSGSPISVSSAAFCRHVRQWLSANVRIVSVDDLLADSSDADLMALTFDDGYANVGREAIPLLMDHGLPATIFVVTGYVGTTNRWARHGGHEVPELPLLDWETLGRLSDGGVTIASHTRAHLPLPQLSQGQLDDEIGGAARELTSRLGLSPRGFAYPYGRVSARVSAAAGRVHQWACTTAFRELTTDAALNLPRLDMWYFERPGLFERWGTPSFRRWVRRRHRLRQVRAAWQRLAGR